MSHTWSRLILTALFAVATMLAQQGRGTISGTVTDAQKAAVPNVAIEIRNVDTNAVFRTHTNDAGFYTAPGLAVGNYEVAGEIAGFKKTVRSGIVLEVDQKAAVNLTIEIGQVTEKVQVVADAPLVDVSSATVGKVVENRRIQELPLNGRNALALAMFTPGVRTSVGPTYGGFTDRGVRISTMSINNSPGGMNGQLLDGNHNVLTYIDEVAVPPAVDAVEEFKVQSGSMSAEFGFTAGGVVNLVTKSGSNAFHGTLYEFLRNDSLDARNTFAVAKDKLRYNQYGGSVGGPVRRDRTFFFFNYEAYRTIQGSPKIATVPVAAERKGDFSNTRDISGALIPVYDPATTRGSGSTAVRDRFPGNIIPASRLDPVAVKTMDLIPLPNRNPTNAFTNSQNYQIEAAPTTDSEQYHGRIDHHISAKNLIYGRFSWFDHRPFQKQVIFPGDMYGRKDDMSNKNVVLSDTHTFGPTLINEFRLGVVRQYFTFADASFGQGWPQKLGLPSNVPNDVIPTIGISGYTSVGYGTVGKRGSTNWNFQESLTKIYGHHTLKFGAEYRLLQASNRQTSNPSGNFSFTAAITGDIQKPTGTGSSVASMMLGAVRTASVDQSQGITMGAWASTFFVQDDWKVTRRLTLNLGLRHDFQPNPTERYNRLLNFDMGGKSSVSGLMGKVVYAGVSGQPRQWRSEDHNDFGPRFGFAFDVFGKGATVVRGGYGVYYPFLFYNANFSSAGTGFTSMTTTYNPAGNDFNYAAFQYKDGFPYSPAQPLGVKGGDDAFLGQAVKLSEAAGPSPMTQQWNFSLQQQMPGRWLLDATYSGNRGSHFITSSWNYNQLDPQNLSLGRALLDNVRNPYAGMVTGALGAANITRRQSLIPFPYYGAINVTNPRLGNYTSNLFLLSAEKKSSRGLTLLFSFTAGKLMSDALQVPQSDFGENNSRLSNFQDSKYNRRAERSVDPQDISKRAVISAVYELPFGPGKRWNSGSAIVRKIVGGWQVNAITTLQTGLPVSVTGANNQSTADRPNSTGVSAKLENPTASRWFNTDAFVNPPDFTYGNIGRVLPDVRAPGTVNWDVSLLKSTTIGERVKLQFRAEAFNLLNHVNLGNPGTGFVAGANGKNTSGSFGVISSARDPRQVQLGLKLRF